MGLDIHVIECGSDPSVAPTQVGQHWINTNSDEHWISVGTAVVGDWKQVDSPSNPGNIDWTVDQSPTVIHASNYTDTTDHTLLTNIGTNSHPQIDTHIADQNNPHNVTVAQIGGAATSHAHTEADITDLDHTDADAIHDNVANEISNVIEKVSPVVGDYLLIEDSSAANVKKRIQIGNLPSSGDVTTTANIADNHIVRGDGGLKGIQESDPEINDTGQILVSDGAKTAPTYAFKNATNTGWFRESNGDLASSVGGQEILEVQTDGRVIISGDTPNYENLVTADNVIPNKKYVDDAIASAGSGNSFGAEFEEASSDSQSSTTSTSWQQKLELCTASLPSGRYRIGWYGEIRQSNGTYSVEFRVQLNNSTTLCETEEEPDDDDNWMPNGGFYYATLSGVQEIDLDYRSSSSSGTAYIKRARLEIWRVS